MSLSTDGIVREMQELPCLVYATVEAQLTAPNDFYARLIEAICANLLRLAVAREQTTNLSHHS